jgi:hypothetical protein
MITRSRTRAERESTTTPTKPIRIKRTQKVGQREHIEYQRADMGRRGGSSSRGAYNRRKLVESSEVAPIRLFTMTEEENRGEGSHRRVSLGFLQNDYSGGLHVCEVNLFALHRKTVLSKLLSHRGVMHCSL